MQLINAYVYIEIYWHKYILVFTEDVTELFSYRDENTSRIVSMFVVCNNGDEAKAQHQLDHLHLCVDAAFRREYI